MKFKRVAIDTSKNVFTLHGVDEHERPALQRELKRSQVESFFGKQHATEVVLELAAVPTIGPMCWVGSAIVSG